MNRTLLICIFTISFLCNVAGTSVAAPISRSELISFRDKALKDSLTPVQLDKMAAKLPQYEEVNKEDVKLLFETYKAICEGYSRNKHQRQAYLLYKQYLSQKERKMYADLQETVAKTRDAVSKRASNLEDELESTEQGADSMNSTSENYASMKTYYQRISALAIIILTFLFAISLVRSGAKLNNMRREINSIREHSALLHKPATIGRMQSGIGNGRQVAVSQQIEQLKQHADELQKIAADPNNPHLVAALKAIAKSEAFLKKSLRQN